MAAASATTPAPAAKPLGRILESDWSQAGVPIAVLAIVTALITPMPAFLLDLLIVIDIMMSVIVLMVAMYIRRPVEFSVFPTTLLLLTLFRLSLNISSARLILANGNTGTAAAGHVIEAFGSFVVGGNYIIGAVIFIVLIAIQYVVINHGAVRISEVTARFTLDSLPGKQMSVDSDLSAGLIDEAEARRKRKEIAAEAEFYGAMDGASRFTQRDAVAGVLITVINIVAGFLIGVLQHGMDLRRALETYTVLTIGDGLVTVIPALMISISGGVIITRTSSDTRLGTDFKTQIFGAAEPLFLASGVLLAIAILPGLPKLPFLAIGAALGVAGWNVRRGRPAAGAQAAAAKPVSAKDNFESMLRIEPLAIELGLGLLRHVEGGQNSPLLRRVSGIRKQMASDLGYVVPPIKIADNLTLGPREYCILLKGVEIARYELPQGCELAVPGGPASKPLDQAQETREPAFGILAWWIPSERAEEANRSGYTTVDAVSVLGTHLSEVVRRHAHELFSRQETKRLLDRVAVEHPKVVEDLVPKLVPLATVQRVFQGLLREQVAVKDAVSILEALGEAAIATKNPVLLTEYVRQAVRRVVVRPYLSRRGDLAAFFLDPSIEQALESSLEHGEHNSHVALSPSSARDILDRIIRSTAASDGASAVITSSGARYALRQLTEASLPRIAVLSHGEIPAGIKVISLGMIQ